MEQKGLLGLAEAAALLRIPYQDAHRLLLTGRLPGRKLLGRWYVERLDVERMARKRQAETTAGHGAK